MNIKSALLTATFLTTSVCSMPLLADSAENAERVSEMVNLSPDDSIACLVKSTFYQVHLKVNDDATLSEFNIPTGYTFVVTGIDYLGGHGLYIESDTSAVQLISNGGDPMVIHDIVIKPGVRICAAGGSGNIHGHLERNR